MINNDKKRLINIITAIVVNGTIGETNEN